MGMLYKGSGLAPSRRNAQDLVDTASGFDNHPFSRVHDIHHWFMHPLRVKIAAAHMRSIVTYGVIVVYDERFYERKYRHCILK